MGRVYAEGLTDAIKARCSTDNRVKRGGSADGTIGGELMDQARAVEDLYRHHLMGWYTEHIPQHVRDWAASIPGIASGELFPRMICLLGHPRVAIPWRWEGKSLVQAGDPYERSLRQFWQFCGCGDPERVPAKNMTREQLLACGKRTQIRPLLHTFSTSLVMSGTPVKKEKSKYFGRPRSHAAAGSPFYKIYVEARQDAETKTHDRQCQNRKRPPQRSNGCGTIANPEWGAPGSPWRPGHVDMHAHRIVHKELLRELWQVSK
jgi:hypothetical protein